MKEVPTKKLQPFGVLVLVISTIVVVISANLWKGDLKVMGVRVKGNRIVTEKEILSLAKIDTSARLFAIDLFAVQQRVLANKFIQSVTVSRDVPAGVEITVGERTPVAGVAMDRIYYLDKDGFILPPVRSENIFDLPVLTGTFIRNGMSPGKQVLDAGMREALAILATAQLIDDELYRRISEVHIDGNSDLILYTAEYGVPVLFGHGEVGSKLVKFDSFWKTFVPLHGAQELQYIDLRFEDQVVVRWNHDKSEIQKSSVHLNILAKEHTWTTLL
jgi:cell division protein FtsQ